MTENFEEILKQYQLSDKKPQKLFYRGIRETKNDETKKILLMHREMDLLQILCAIEAKPMQFVDFFSLPRRN